MNVRFEIEKFADPAEREDLLAVFNQYHMQSEWNVMSCCEFIGKYPNSHRKWHLSPAGEAVVAATKLAEQNRILREAGKALHDAIEDIQHLLEHGEDPEESDLLEKLSEARTAWAQLSKEI